MWCKWTYYFPCFGKMFLCPSFLKSFKKLYGIKLPKIHHLTWAQDILDDEVCATEKAGYILCGMWSVWTSRNNRIHGDSSTNLTQACRWAHDMASDLMSNAKPQGEGTKTKTTTYWQRPQEGYYKINVDATFNSKDEKGASGVIIRGADGTIVAASSKWYDSVPNVLTAEALACRDGAKMMKILNIRQGTMETGSRVSFWRSRKHHRASILSIINEIQELVEGCSGFDIYHVKREANIAAHKVAKFATESNPECSWIHQLPNSLLLCTRQDCNHVPS